MVTISIDPIIFGIGHLHIHWYSLIVFTAITVGVWLTAREASRKGIKKEDTYDVAIWVIFSGLIGARLFHVLDHWSDVFAANPIRIFYTPMPVYEMLASLGIFALVWQLRKRN